MIAANLPALQVVIPLLSAPLCLLLRRPAYVWLYACLVMLAALIISILLASSILSEGELSYAMGGWTPPWGIEYRVDALSSFMLLIVSGIGFIVMLFSGSSIARELPPHKQTLYYVAALLCIAGLQGIVITGDAFNVFVFLEISSLSTYILVSLGPDRRSLTAAFQYLIMGTIGATFYLIGVGMLYVMTGTLNMADIAQRLPAVIDTRTVHAAFAFLTVGVSLKLALFPLHLWLPNSYTYAPSAASALLAATATKVAIYVMVRIIFTFYGADFAFKTLPLGEILMVMAVPAILIGSTVAIYQDNMKRMLAYSSIAQIGYMILGISLGSVTGLTAGLLHLFNHALMKGGLFLALGCIMYTTGSVRLEQMRGLGKAMPWTIAAIILGGMSLVGIPLTAGFISKWYLVLAALEQGRWILVAVILFGSLLAVIYIGRLIETTCFRQREDASIIREAPLPLLVPTWILIIANIYFGIDTEFSAGLASRAATALTGIAP